MLNFEQAYARASRQEAAPGVETVFLRKAAMDDSASLEQSWEPGWSGHNQAQLLRFARLPLSQKLEWLEQAQELSNNISISRIDAAERRKQLGTNRGVKECPPPPLMADLRDKKAKVARFDVDPSEKMVCQMVA